MKDSQVWVICRPVREKKETAGICKFPDNHYKDYMKEFELLHMGPKEDVIAMDVTKWEGGKSGVNDEEVVEEEHKEFTEEELKKILGTETVIMDVSDDKAKEKSPETSKKDNKKTAKKK